MIFNKRKKGEVSGSAILLVVAILVVGLGLAGSLIYSAKTGATTVQQTTLPSPTPAAAAAAAATGEVSATSPLCPGIAGVTLTLSSFDAKNPATATVERHTTWVKVNGLWARQGTGTNDGGTITVGPAKEVGIMFGNNTEINDATGNAGFYPTFITRTLGCTDLPISEFQKDKADQNLTIVIVNQGGTTVNTGGGSHQALGADGSVTVRFQVTGSSDDYFGDDKIAVVFDANKTSIRKVTLLNRETGEPYPKISPPGVHTEAPHWSQIADSWAYEIPGIVGAQFKEYDVLIEGAGTEPTQATNITGGFYDMAWFINQDTDQPEKGYNDEMNNNVGALNQNFTIVMG